MKNFFKNIWYRLLCDKKTKEISNTKLGVWLSAGATILLSNNYINTETFYTIGALTTGLIGIGIRDLRK